MAQTNLWSRMNEKKKQTEAEALKKDTPNLSTSTSAPPKPEEKKSIPVEKKEEINASLTPLPTLATTNLQKNLYIEAKSDIQSTLTDEIPLEEFKKKSKDEDFKKHVRKRINEIVYDKNLPFTKEQKDNIVENIYNDVLGFGPLEAFFCL